MTQIIEVRDTPIPADAWANYIPQIPELDSGSLNSLVDAFIAQGGKINAIPAGVTADATIGSVPSTGELYSPDERAAHRAERAAKRESHIHSGDEQLVAMIRPLLASIVNGKALANAVNVSHSKLQRILRDHFANEPLADRFRHQDRDQQVTLNEAALVAKIRIALGNGVVGVGPVAKYCGSSFTKVAELNRRCKLGIPKGVGGFRKKVTA